MDEIVNGVLGALGIEGAAVMGVLALVSLVCRLIGKAIPDNATGALGIVRKVCKFVGLYVSNRVESGVSVNDAAKAVAASGEVRRKPMSL